MQRQIDQDLDDVYNYPFPGSKHLDPIGVNEDQVQLMVRTKNDFSKPDKLANPL